MALELTIGTIARGRAHTEQRIDGEKATSNQTIFTREKTKYERISCGARVTFIGFCRNYNLFIFPFKIIIKWGNRAGNQFDAVAVAVVD